MKNKNQRMPQIWKIFILVSFLLLACDEFVNIDPPHTDLIKATVFKSDATADAAMIGIYYDMKQTGFASGSSNSITFYVTYSADEQLNYSVDDFQEFNDNELTPENGFVLQLWSDMFKTILKANSLIEGLAASQTLSEGLKIQLEGEAKFVRAFCYFYLVNLFGDVPLVMTTDYVTNANIARTPSVEVYQQIINDLKDAQDLLPRNYTFAGDERVRANHGAATALLARTYLHMGEWGNAEIEATRIIQNTGLYTLVSDLDSVFHRNSTEAILQFHTTFWPNDYFTFLVYEVYGPVYGSLRHEFPDKFEGNDQRLIKWVRSLTVGGKTYFFPGKYKNDTKGEEYSTLFRLAEVYLIRAEARAQQDDISGSQDDLNTIRERAGLDETLANDKETLLAAIEYERIVELFTEQGLRWLDLKRTNRADAVLAPIKGSTWQPTDVLYPIPLSQLLNDPAMKDAQNPGY
jgi:starch-binding outer membrane protein, SusD/RagB family